MECLRTCTQDNVVVNLRPFGADLAKPTARKMDEAFKAFIMLGSAVVYSAVMLGPWGALKSAAYTIGSGEWIGYALAFLAFVFGVLPGSFLLVVWIGCKLSGARQTLHRSFTAFAYTLVPLGLMAWIAFSLSFVFANASYIGPALSDPLGAGWNLLGAAGVAWSPLAMQIVPLLQVAALIGGVAWACVTARRIASESNAGGVSRRRHLQAWPVMIFCLLVTAGLMGLLIG
jgi:hypothetical protein